LRSVDFGAKRLGVVTLSLAALVLSPLGNTQQPEVQFLRTWQPADGKPLAEVSGLTLAADGAVLFTERDRGALWRLAGEEASPTDLAGAGRPFSSKKTVRVPSACAAPVVK